MMSGEARKKHKLRIKGPAGAIETVIEEPTGAPAGLALIAHPHPLKGGSLDNKVAWTLARAALSCGLIAVRPNFRGVGATAAADMRVPRPARARDEGSGTTEKVRAPMEPLPSPPLASGMLPPVKARTPRAAPRPASTGVRLF